jgi:hypothetical protein
MTQSDTAESGRRSRVTIWLEFRPSALPGVWPAWLPGCYMDGAPIIASVQESSSAGTGSYPSTKLNDLVPQDSVARRASAAGQHMKPHQ